MTAYPEQISTRSGVAQAVLVTAFGVLPGFMVGALSVQLSEELELSPRDIGLATSAMFLTSGVLARVSGRIVQRLGARVGSAVAATTSAASLFSISVATSLWLLIFGLVVGGLGNALSQPSANLTLSSIVAGRRLGLALGVKQGAVPAATLLGALTVPLLAVTVGWRWAFAAASFTALTVAIVAIRNGRLLPSAPPTATPGLHPITHRTLVLLAIAGGLGVSATTALGVFFVDSSVGAGLEPWFAGAVFAVISLGGLLIRIALGWFVDAKQHVDPLALIAGALFAAVVGFAAMATGGMVGVIVGGACAFCLGWSWTGLSHYVVVRGRPQDAARATGILQTGLSSGAAFGPITFGHLVSTISYRSAWIAAAAVSLVAVAVLVVAIRQQDTSTEHSNPKED